ncbi:MAG: PBP1A family penicillin-binding protein [Leptospirales bacterium]|nr:PBP1A family penicillin-binding protein [Leptospirales bacterium]
MKKKDIVKYILLFLIMLLPFFYIIYSYAESYNIFISGINIRQPLATEIYDRNGILISQLYDEYRTYAKIEDIPETVVKSFLAAEDSSFYMHSGFSIIGIVRALFIDIVSGDFRQGGSTITQQLVKQLFTEKRKSVRRKLVELFLAKEFEKKFSKNEILEMYLNQVYLGHGVYGVSSAAEFYFQKSIKDINIIEASLMAGIPSAPEKFSPLKNPAAAYDKSLSIIFNLISSGYIEKEDTVEKFHSFWIQYSDKIKTEFSEAGIRKDTAGEAKWFVEYLRRELIDKYGEEMVYRGGLKVYTTIDIDYQRAAESILEKSIERQNRYTYSINSYKTSRIDNELAEIAADRGNTQTNRKEYINQSIKFNREMLGNLTDELSLVSMISGSLISSSITKHQEVYENRMSKSKAEGALIALDPSSGEILAMVGGSEFNTINQLNRAVQSRRQPGSTFKAFVYGAAIEDKNITAATPFYDLPLTYGGAKNSWTPSNYDKRYSGRVLARKALASSLNIVSAKIYDFIGGEKIAKFTSSLTDADYKRFQLDPTLSLGTTELSLLEMTKGFAVYANGGVSLPVKSITKIEDRYGKNILAEDKKLSPERVVSEQTAFIMTSMMRDVVNSGTATYAVRQAAGFRLPCAGKTGTNSNFRDAWFIGYTPDIAAGVWIGCDSPQYSLGAGMSGSAVAAPIWGLFMNEIYKKKSIVNFPQKPTGVSEISICSISGDIAERDCPTINEYFITGTEPDSKCSGLHGKLSNIKELINKQKHIIDNKNIPELFELMEE